MTKGQLLYKLEPWKGKFDIDKGIKDLENKLKEYDLDYSNIEFILRYTRDNYGEISVETKPKRDLGYIKFYRI